MLEIPCKNCTLNAMLNHPKFIIDSLVLPSDVFTHKIYRAEHSSSLLLESLDVDFLSSAQRAYFLELKSPKSSREFLLSRYLLAHILTPIGPWKDRWDTSTGMIQWPHGWTGSLSHKDGHCLLGLAPPTKLTSLGIDMERQRTKNDISTKVMSDIELTNLSNWLKLEKEILCGLVFSAKEALFKCLYPLGKKMFWFHDAEIVSATASVAETTAIKLMIKCPSDRHGVYSLNEFEVIAFLWPSVSPTRDHFWISSCVIKR